MNGGKSNNAEKEARDWFDFAPIGFVTLDKSGTVFESNRAAAELLGVDRKSLSHADLSRFVAPEYRNAWDNYRRVAFAGDGTQACEIEMRRSDGCALWVRLEGRLAGPTENRRCRIALLDITERRKSEDARDELTHSLEHRIVEQRAHISLQAEAIEHLAEGVMIIEGQNWLESRILFVNAAMRRITGYESAELVGRPRSLLQGPDTDISTLDRINHQLVDGRTCEGEVVQYRKDGKPYFAHLSITRFSRQEGRPAVFVSIHRDITVQKQASNELERRRDQLKQLASELMLAEERERRRLAEDLHDGVGQALFQARTKIAALSPASAAKEAGAILEQVGRMMNTMVFELSPPVLRTLGLRPALKSLAMDMQQRYNLSVDIDDDGKDFTLPERAAMVLFRCARELLINVSKHAKTDRATLSMRRLKREVRLTVEDHGKGFDLNQSSPVDSGHFGLFSVRERLSGIGGTFEVRSSPGQGTSTTIAAPAVDAVG